MAARAGGVWGQAVSFAGLSKLAAALDAFDDELHQAIVNPPPVTHFSGLLPRPLVPCTCAACGAQAYRHTLCSYCRTPQP